MCTINFLVLKTACSFSRSRSLSIFRSLPSRTHIKSNWCRLVHVHQVVFVLWSWFDLWSFKIQQRPFYQHKEKRTMILSMTWYIKYLNVDCYKFGLQFVYRTNSTLLLGWKALNFSTNILITIECAKFSWIIHIFISSQFYYSEIVPLQG